MKADRSTNDQVLIHLQPEWVQHPEDARDNGEYVFATLGHLSVAVYVDAEDASVQN